MMKAAYSNAGSVAIPRPANLTRLAEKVLRAEGLRGRVNLVFCENDYVRDLNLRFRKLDKVTDVLSFLYEEEDVLGEIYIASAQAKMQAPRWKNSFYDELKRLVVHGALHLAGYDHMNAKDRKLMRMREDLYLGLSK
jgi:probable rRNA maturation factor